MNLTEDVNQTYQTSNGCIYENGELLFCNSWNNLTYYQLRSNSNVELGMALPLEGEFDVQTNYCWQRGENSSEYAKILKNEAIEEMCGKST